MSSCRIRAAGLLVFVALSVLPLWAAQDSTARTGADTAGTFFSTTGCGFAFDREQIYRSDAATLAELLSVLPGITIQRTSLLAGTETPRWHGMEIQRLHVYLDGVPFPEQDLCWPSVGRWSPASFKRVSVCLEPGRGGFSDLRVELESAQPAPMPPIADAFWQTGPFEENLLDILFSRRLSRRFSLFFHSRSLAVESRAYDHPDVITTFYEAIGRDTARIVREGYNPMQSVRELRVGAEYDIGWGRLSGMFSSYNSADSVLDPASATWTELRKTRGFYALNLNHVGSPIGLWSAGYYQNRTQAGLWLSDSLTLGRLRLQTGAETVVSSDSGHAPTRLWIASQVPLGPVTWSSAQEFGLDNGEREYATRQSIVLENRYAFLRANAHYAVALSGDVSSYAGAPVFSIAQSTDTSAGVSVEAGGKWRGNRLWARRDEIRRGGFPLLVLNGQANTPAQGSTSIGIDRLDRGPIRFSEVLSAGDGNPGISNHFWASYARRAVQNKLLCEATVFADYVGENVAADLVSQEWLRIDPFWDVSLKLALQIRSFRLFYKIGNVFDTRRAYFVPYSLPGLNFQWGIHWTLRG